MPGPTRRSGRKRKANTKYLGTGWDKGTLRLLRESSESSGSSPSEDSAKEVESVGGDFAGRRIASADISTPTEDGYTSDASDGAANRTPLGSDEDIKSVTSGEANTPTQEGRRHSGTIDDVHPQRANTGRSCGIAPLSRRSRNIEQIFGSGDTDLKPILHARDTWLQDRDRILPSRETLAAIQSSTHEDVELLGDPDVEDEDISIATRQELQLIDLASEDAARYLIPNAARQSVVLGPVSQQKLHKLEYFKALDVSEAWLEATTPQVAEEKVDAQPNKSVTSRKVNGGWIINVGEKIQSMAWLPGNEEDAQLLAIACRSTSKQRNAVPPTSTTRSPAFYPSASYPSCIQLWAFHRSSFHDGPSKQPSEASALPELCIVYALDAGDTRQLQWQPSTTSKQLKLLAVLSTDGFVRLLALNPAYLGGKPAACVRVKTAPMQIRSPAATVFTAMCWASPSDLILGASDGTIHIYNIQDHTNPTPYLSLPLHNTYIMNIVSVVPSSTLPFVASTSAAGDLLLTDLRAPGQDYVHVPKARLPTKPLIYLPQTRSFLAVTEPTGITEPGPTASLVQCHHLRHFYQSQQICKLLAGSGAATALAGSPHHPCILVGNAKGSVFATNYLRAVLSREDGTLGGDGYLQIVYEYDWRLLTAAERQAKIEAETGVSGKEREDDRESGQDRAEKDVDLFHGHDVRPGMSRFTENFPPEPIDLSTKGPIRPGRNDKRKSSQSSRKQHKKKAKQDEANRFGTDVIYEEEQAVTCLEWNPNVRFAGWAAVGWGSGIVRVGDLSHGGV